MNDAVLLVSKAQCMPLTVTSGAAKFAMPADVQHAQVALVRDMAVRRNMLLFASILKGP